MQTRVIDAFWERVDKVDLTGCWLWTGHIRRDNLYGTWSYSHEGKTKTVYVHRFAYEQLVGPVPDGNVLDHKCRVRFCINPDHLEPTTQQINLERRLNRDGGASFQRNKTHCPKGHPYAGDNLAMRKDGKRSCRACEREWTRQYRERNPQPKAEPQTHCKFGHEFTPENTHIGKQHGQRICKICNRRRVQESRARKRSKDA